MREIAPPGAASQAIGPVRDSGGRPGSWAPVRWGWTMTDLAGLTATELVAAYRSGSVSPVEATAAALAAIDAYDDAGVNAFVLVDPDGAMAAAERSAARWRAGEPLGPGDGVPTSIKDLLYTRGWPTLRGAALIDERGPWDDDAPAVARLRESGAVLLGKTTTPEFGWKGVTDSPRYGPTGNPWNPALTAGGSSGGSAAAVGLRMGAWSVGTDGGGSLRIPAAFTGTVTIKPTYGLVPVWPASPFGTLSHAGPITRGVADAALMLDILTGFDPRDWSALPTPAASFRDGLDDGVGGLRVAFSPDLGHVRNDPRVEAVVRAAAGVLADAGAHVEEVDPGFADPVDAFHTLWFTGAAKVVQPYGAGALEQVDPGPAARRRARSRVRRGGLPGRGGGAGGPRRADGPVPPHLRPAADADPADHRVPEGRRRAAGMAFARLDQLDAVHVPVQPDPAAGGERAVRVRRRPSGRPADRRPAARRRAGAAGRPRVRAGHRPRRAVTPTDPGIARWRLHTQQVARPAHDDPAEVVRRMGAVQSQDYLASMWAVGLRTRGATASTVEQALADRAIVRTHFMRNTVHLVAPEDLRWMLRLVAPRIRMIIDGISRAA